MPQACIFRHGLGALLRMGPCCRHCVHGLPYVVLSLAAIAGNVLVIVLLPFAVRRETAGRLSQAAVDGLMGAGWTLFVGGTAGVVALAYHRRGRIHASASFVSCIFLAALGCLIANWVAGLHEEESCASVNALLLLVVFSQDGMEALEYFNEHPAALLYRRYFIPLTVLLMTTLVFSYFVICAPAHEVSLEAAILIVLLTMRFFSAVARGLKSLYQKVWVIVYTVTMIILQLAIIVCYEGFDLERSAEIMRQVAAVVILCLSQKQFWLELRINSFRKPEQSNLQEAWSDSTTRVMKNKTNVLDLYTSNPEEKSIE